VLGEQLASHLVCQQAFTPGAKRAHHPACCFIFNPKPTDNARLPDAKWALLVLSAGLGLLFFISLKQGFQRSIYHTKATT